MDIQNLINYALVKSIYEEKKDYINIFIPFVLKVLDKENIDFNIEIIQNKLSKSFEISIPLYTIKTIINKSRKKDYCDILKDGKIILKENGKNFLYKIYEKENSINRDINLILEDIREYIKKQHIMKSNEQILTELKNFLKYNIIDLIEFFNPKGEFKNLKKNANNISINNNKYIIDYLLEINKLKNNFYQIFENIFYGSLISTLLTYSDLNMINKKISRLTIYLDTNFVFNIFGFRNQTIAKSSNELYNLLKSYKIKLKIFDFTEQEIIRFLRNYNPDQYFNSIEVDDVYYILKSKGWTLEDCYNFIYSFNDKLKNLGIEKESTNFDFKKINIENEKYKSLLNYKENTKFLKEINEFSIKHDLAAIEMIKRIRKTSKRYIEDSIAVFLTCDTKLSKYDFYEEGHIENFTCPEIINDKFLTNFLWLKNPQINKNLPLNYIISLNSENLINRNIWYKFFDNHIKLREEDKINEKDIGLLIYHHRLSEDLTNIDSDDQITESFILNKIEEAKNEYNEKMKKKI